MWMSDKEIIREYLEAKDKGGQVIILADQNMCDKKDIRKILERHGIRPVTRKQCARIKK